MYSMPAFRVLSDRIVPEPGGEGFLLPVPRAAPVGSWRATADPADFPAVEAAFRAAGFFRPELNTFVADWRRAALALAVDVRALLPPVPGISGAPQALGVQRRLWAALNHGLAAGIDVAGFLADRPGPEGRAALAAALAGFLRDEKTSPYRLGRFLFWNGVDAGAFSGEPDWMAA